MNSNYCLWCGLLLSAQLLLHMLLLLTAAVALAFLMQKFLCWWASHASTHSRTAGRDRERLGDMKKHNFVAITICYGRGGGDPHIHTPQRLYVEYFDMLVLFGVDPSLSIIKNSLSSLSVSLLRKWKIEVSSSQPLARRDYDLWLLEREYTKESKSCVCVCERVKDGDFFKFCRFCTFLKP